MSTTTLTVQCGTAISLVTAFMMYFLKTNTKSITKNIPILIKIKAKKFYENHIFKDSAFVAGRIVKFEKLTFGNFTVKITKPPEPPHSPGKLLTFLLNKKVGRLNARVVLLQMFNF